MTPNAALISMALTLLALVLSIFGAAWLNQRSTERLIEQLEKRFEGRFDSLEKRFDERLARIEARLDRIERQLEAIFKPILPGA